MGFPSRVYDDAIKEVGSAKHRTPPIVRVLILFSTKVSSTDDVRVAFADLVDRVKRNHADTHHLSIFQISDMDSPELADTPGHCLDPADTPGQHGVVTPLLSSLPRKIAPASHLPSRSLMSTHGPVCPDIVSTSYLEGLGPSAEIWFAFRFSEQSSSAYPQDQTSTLRILPIVPHFFYDVTTNSL